MGAVICGIGGRGGGGGGSVISQDLTSIPLELGELPSPLRITDLI